MRRMLLMIGLSITLCNVALGVYAATCSGPGGSRICGRECGRIPNGQCVCEGSCTAEEMRWVAGDPPAPIAEDAEVY